MTGSSVVLSIIMIIASGIGLVSGNGVALVIFGFLAGILLVDLVLSKINFAKIELSRNLPDTVWQNDQFLFEYHIKNNKKHIYSTGIQIYESDSPDANKYEFGLFTVAIPPKSDRPAGRWVWAENRGLLCLDTFTAESKFPFGMTRKFKNMSSPHVITIWPAKGKLKYNPLVHGAHLYSNSPSKSKGGDDEFYALREYRQGDDLRWVHWRKSANRGKLVIKEMSQPNPNIIMLLLDFSEYDPDYDFENVEKILRFAATLIDQCIHHFDYDIGLGIIYNGRYHAIKPAKGLQAHRNMLNFLAELNLEIFYQTTPVSEENLKAKLLETNNKQTRKIYVSLDPYNDLEGSGGPSYRDSVYISVHDLDRYFEDNPYFAISQGEQNDKN